MEKLAAIQAQGLVKSFGRLCAVDHVSLDLRPGAALALLGPNGAGKTTLVEMLEGLQTPDEGRIQLFGKSWQGPETATLRSLLGVCLQDTRLPETLSCLEVLRLFASFHGLGHERSQQVLEAVGLNDKAGAWTKTLSGGQRQRLALAVAMLAQPQLLLLDEPTTGLDPAARREVWALIESLKSQGCALLLTTHYMDEAEALCPEVALMHRGRILQRGQVPALLKRHAGGDRIELKLDKAAPASLLKKVPGLIASDKAPARELNLRVRDLSVALPALTKALRASRLKVLNLATRRASLEDLFLALAGGSLNEDKPGEAA